jgi:hypothetical protein
MTEKRLVKPHKLKRANPSQRNATDHEQMQCKELIWVDIICSSVHGAISRVFCNFPNLQLTVHSIVCMLFLVLTFHSVDIVCIAVLSFLPIYSRTSTVIKLKKADNTYQCFRSCLYLSGYMADTFLDIYICVCVCVCVCVLNAVYFCLDTLPAADS